MGNYHINPKDDVNNYRFARRLETNTFEAYDARPGKLRWVIVVAAVSLLVVAVAIRGEGVLTFAANLIQ